MNLNKLASAAILLLIVSAAVLTILMNQSFGIIVNADVQDDDTCTLTVQSPTNLAAIRNNVSLVYAIDAKPGYSFRFSSVLFEEYLFSGYILDYDKNVVATNLSIIELERERSREFLKHTKYVNLTYEGNQYLGNTDIADLSEGNHSLVVWVRAEENYLSFSMVHWTVFSDPINFTVDNTPPQISVLSPIEASEATNATLTFTVNEPASQVAYSVDGAENVSAAGNCTLPMMSDGNHTVKVYVWDAAGNVGTAQTVTFTITSPTPLPPTPTPTAQSSILTPASGASQSSTADNSGFKLDTAWIIVLLAVVCVFVLVVIVGKKATRKRENR